MTNITTDNDDDLNPYQEYAIAGVVILLFGLLYWFLNYGWNIDAETAATVKPAGPFAVVVGQDKLEFNAAAQETAAATGAEGNAPATATMEKAVPPAALPPAPIQATLGSGQNSSTPAQSAVEKAADSNPVASTPVEPVVVADAAPTEKPIPETAFLDAAPAGKPAPETAFLDAAPAGKPAIGTAFLEVTPVDPDAFKAEAETHTPAPSSTEAPVSQPVQAAEYKLPDGGEVAIGETGFAAELLQAINQDAVDKPIISDKITFSKGSVQFDAASEQPIREIAALLHTFPNIKLLIRGHTDETGIPGRNTELSLLRANAVGAALVKLGIDRRRLSIMGMGDLEPIDTNATEEGRKNNRRVDVMIIH
ncbi:OmpA family protein [Candidatus Thiothrix sp. Deng01]|uniref:OmpA family protein n=1 Tax=Candidatus Thiothrix phosphatis TaxID=3112415 RepID=A0ABU6D2L7_9GAMM|nr:OmpA family protein [Candidatus Thiothrix sp. Deng01]MEB4593310.1 OmpA family protein [Candidatus Thiothrix sp. Deng01]